MLMPQDGKTSDDESSSTALPPVPSPNADSCKPTSTSTPSSSFDAPLPPSTSAPRSTRPGSPSRPQTPTGNRFLTSARKAVGLLLVAAVITRLLAGPWMGHLRVESGGDGDAGRGGQREGPVHDDAWNPEWDATTPLLPDETFPRQCDLFTTTHSSQYDTWSTRTTLSLPLRGELYFHGRGDYLGGRVKVSVGQLSRKDRDGDEVLVKVEATYKKTSRLDGWHVCRTGDDRVAGVVLVTPDRPRGWQSDDIKFHVQIDYPSPSSSDPMALPSLSLDTLNMDISTTDLIPSYTFSTIDYRTTNGGVTLDGLNTSSLRIGTSNASILAKLLRGLTSTPMLRTTNGRIDCPNCWDPQSDRHPIAWDVSTSNGGVSGRFYATKQIGVRTTSGSIEGEFQAPLVRLFTVNARIKAQVGGLGEGGAEVTSANGAIDVTFDIPEQSSSGANKEKKPVKVPLKVSTTNGYLSAHLRSLPDNVSLSARLHSANGPLRWQGHSHYQGSFSFSTSPFVGGVSLDALKHPYGEAERKLSVTEIGKQPWTSQPSAIRGTVARHGEKKGDKSVSWGDIVGETSNGNVKASV